MQADGLYSHHRQTHLCFLLQQHLVQDGHQPVLKLAVVIIGHQQVPYPTPSSGEGEVHVYVTWGKFLSNPIMFLELKQ